MLNKPPRETIDLAKRDLSLVATGSSTPYLRRFRTTISALRQGRQANSLDEAQELTADLIALGLTAAATRCVLHGASS